jgi:hypothetical protein
MHVSCSDGLVILCLHDFGDVWLNWAKVFK